jgi:hypothetical protein
MARADRRHLHFGTASAVERQWMQEIRGIFKGYAGEQRKIVAGLQDSLKCSWMVCLSFSIDASELSAEISAINSFLIVAQTIEERVEEHKPLRLNG